MEISGATWNWAKLLRTMQEMHESDFMSEMMERRSASGSDSPMGKIDCSLLYALTRWRQPNVIVETGGFLGMSSAFMLKALADEKVSGAEVISIEWMEDIDHGSLIPQELRAGYRPLVGRVEDFMKDGSLPEQLDFFLHDSSHRLKHMLMEFRYFFPRLSPGGLLVSHDVDMNAAFTKFTTKTYRHDRIGQSDPAATQHALWGRIGNLGFIVKNDFN